MASELADKVVEHNAVMKKTIEQTKRLKKDHKTALAAALAIAPAASAAPVTAKEDLVALIGQNAVLEYKNSVLERKNSELARQLEAIEARVATTGRKRGRSPGRGDGGEAAKRPATATASA